MSNSFRPHALRCEYRTTPIGLDVRQPRFSWTAGADAPGFAQAGYRVLVASDPTVLRPGEADLWDSDDVDSPDPYGVEYGGEPLRSRQRAWWTVLVRGDDGAASDWSEPSWWEAGLAGEPWEGSWITHPPESFERTDHRPAPFFRREFAIDGDVVRARLHATALGLYRFLINGQSVGDSVLRPGWTDYGRLVQYQTYDVTNLLRRGRNAAGFLLGEGWYSGHIGVACAREGYGADPLARAMLVVETADGASRTVATDASWVATYGPILTSDLLKGEIYDARRELGAWADPGYDDGGWAPATVQAGPDVQLVAEAYEPVRVTQELTPQQVTTPVFSTWVFDLGQNMVGWSRLRVSAPTGTEFVVRHGEALTAHGTVYTENLRLATSTDRFIAGGAGAETYEPSFTFHGFRYVEVEAPVADLGADAVTGLVVHNDLRRTGTFRCSDEMVNRIYDNSLWSQRGNFLEAPTDCPQRNERLGWLGDARIFSATARLNYDVAAFFTKWLRDVRLARTADGLYPDFAPWIGHGTDGAPGWADAGVFVPYLMYQTYGDTRIIDENFDAMAGYVDLVHKANPSLVRTQRVGVNWGDWLSMPESDPHLGRGQGPIIDSVYSTTPKDVFATAFFARSARLLAHMAAATGRDEDAHRFGHLADDVTEVWNQEFVAEDGTIAGDTQTAYALGICFDLLSPRRREAAGNHLVAAVERHRHHISTGIAGTELILPALTATDHLDVAYRLLLNDTFPSWGYTIRNGATTVWERWDGWTEERGFQDIRMNSFNHYALGAVAAWLYEVVGGLSLDPTVPGAAHFVIHPRPGGDITSATTTYDSIRGRAAVSWQRSDGRLTIDVEVPATATAAVHLPGSGAVHGDGSDVRAGDGVLAVDQVNGETVVEVRSGRHRFMSR